MATRVVPLPAVGQQLLEDIYKHPSDMGLRLILADCLEDAGDPRAGLVRLLPQLLALPKREKPRDDVPCRVWKYGNPWLYSTRKEWPSLQIHHVEGVGWYGRGWTGLHNVGRLLWIALTHAFFDFRKDQGDDNESAPFMRKSWMYVGRSWPKEVAPFVWAYSCRLIGPKNRDQILYYPHAVHYPARAGSFCTYLSWAEEVIRHWVIEDLGILTTQERAARALTGKDLTLQGVLWSRWLDIRDAFVQMLPWQDAWQAYLQSRAPKPERGSPAWRVRKNCQRS